MREGLSIVCIYILYIKLSARRVVRGREINISHITFYSLRGFLMGD